METTRFLGILCGLIATGMLAGCAGVSESNPSEKITIQTAEKLDKTVLQERLDEAIRKNDLESVKKLVAQGADISGVLGLAAMTGSRDMVKYLLDHGVDVNKANDRGVTPLMLASGKPVVQCLVEYGAKLDISDKDGETALIWCAKLDKDLEKIKYLVKSGADLRCRDKEGNSAILAAAFCGKLQNITYFLSLGLDINDRNNNGMTPLHYACNDIYRRDGEKMEMIRYLVEHGADVNAHSFSQKWARTPLHFAVLKNSGDHIAAYLLKHGAKVDEKDGTGQTALHLCCILPKHLETIKLLVSCNAEINVEDLTGMTPLHYAVVDLEYVKYLVEHGANVNAKNTHKGRTPLHVAVLATADTEVLTYLLDHHAEINRQDDDGKTPLHYALYCLNMKAAKCLVEHGANVYLHDKEGKTPLDLAEERKQYEIAKYLKKNDAVSGKSLNGTNKK